MKKIAVFLLVFVLSLSSAFAMSGVNYPQYDGVPKENSFGGQFGSDAFLLEFDSAADYSYRNNGYLQSCFFAFDESGDYYLEMYLLLPEALQSGDSITPQSAFAAGLDNCSVTLFEVDEDNNERTWFAGQLLGSAYPENSAFTINIAQADYTQSSLHISGSISASLCLLKDGSPSEESLSLSADFDFTLPLSNEASGQTTPESQSPVPAPAFTLPPDAIAL